VRRVGGAAGVELSVDRFHIAHVLNHRSVTHSTVTAIYDRYRYDKEKRAALEKWAEVVSGIVEVRVDRYSFPVKTLAFSTPRRFIPAHSASSYPD